MLVCGPGYGVPGHSARPVVPCTQCGQGIALTDLPVTELQPK